MSLSPALGMSIPPARNRPEDPARFDDRRYNQALFLREQGRTEEALLVLDELVRSHPEHADARTLLHKLAVELGHEDKARAHVDWVVAHYAQRSQHANTCTIYRTTRMAFPQLEWAERTLLHALVAGDKANEARVVLDATKMLLQSYPTSHALPRALYASAGVQHMEGRPDLARATLQNLLNRFPMDPLAAVARRKLVELA